MHAVAQMGAGGALGGIHATFGQAPGPGPNPSPGGINVTLAGAPVGSVAASPAGVSVGFAASAEPISVSVAAGGGHRRSLPTRPTAVVGPAGPASASLAASALPAAAPGLSTPLPAAAASIAGRMPVITPGGLAARLVVATCNPGQGPVQLTLPAAFAQAAGQIVAGYSSAAFGWRDLYSVIAHLPQLILRPRCPASAAVAGRQETMPDTGHSPGSSAEGAAEGPAARHIGFPPMLPAAVGSPLGAGAKAERLLSEEGVHVDAPYTTVTLGAPRAGASSTNVVVSVPGRKLAAARALDQADAAAPAYSVVPVETPQGGPAGGNVEVIPGRRLAALRGLIQVGGIPASVETAFPTAAPGPNPDPSTLAQVSAAAPYATVSAEAPRMGFAATYINAPGINFAMGPSQHGAVTNVVVQVGRKLAAGNTRALRQASAVAQGTVVAVAPAHSGAAEAVVTAPGAAVAVEPGHGAAGTDVQVQVGRKRS